MLAGESRAQCDGTGDRTLTMTDVAPIGGDVTVEVQTLPGLVVYLMFSLGQGPNDAGAYGTICLDFPILLGFILPTDANGYATFTETVPCDDNAAGLTIYAQYITCQPGSGKGTHGSSNQESLLITEGLGPGSLCTFTQEAWGSDCNVHEIGCRLEASFDAVFPTGVLIGDPDGDDDDDEYASRWCLTGKIQHYLPQTLKCTQLRGDHKNPTSESGFRFGAELLALKLNVGFDDAGILDDLKCLTSVKLGDLLLASCVDEDLVGWTVRDLIDLADLAISGALGPGPFDLDGDGAPDVTLDDLCDALHAVNVNFEDCVVDLGCLELPGSSS
jgi:hypothetical protein